MTTQTRSIGRHGATLRKAGWLASGLMLAVAALAPSTVGAATVYATVTGHTAFSDEANKADFWGTDCTKIDAVDGNLGDAYVLGADYDLVVVKAGSGANANTEFADASAGESVWADTNGDGIFNPGGQDGDKGISHIIFCGPAETTTTTTETTDTTTETSDTTTETTDTTTDTTDTTTDTTDTTTDTTDTTTDTSDTTTETTDTTTDTSDTTTETTDTTTDTSDTTTETTDTTTTDTTTTLTGEELPAVGTPGVTPPPTDTIGAVAPASSTDGFRMLLVGFALILGVALFLLPKEVASKK